MLLFTLEVETDLSEALDWALKSGLLTGIHRVNFLKKALKKSFKESYEFLKKNPKLCEYSGCSDTLHRIESREI